MALSPLRPPASPVQDAPRKISTPQPPATPSTPRQFGQQKSGSATRTSNPALLAATGSSGFDPGARAGGPRISLPQTGAPQPTSGAGAVGTVSSKKIDALFNAGSKTFEKILSGFGIATQPISDPTARLKSRSDQLGQVLTNDPSLKGQVSQSDLYRAFRISKIFSNPTFYNALDATQKAAVDSYQGTMQMLCAEWPPPPSGGRGNG